MVLLPRSGCHSLCRRGQEFDQCWGLAKADPFQWTTSFPKFSCVTTTESARHEPPTLQHNLVPAWRVRGEGRDSGREGEDGGQGNPVHAPHPTPTSKPVQPGKGPQLHGSPASPLRREARDRKEHRCTAKPGRHSTEKTPRSTFQDMTQERKRTGNTFSGVVHSPYFLNLGAVCQGI